jgi:hypothetical protein
MSAPADAYPLRWPDGWARTSAGQRRTARYKVSIESAVKELHETLGLMGALSGSIVISSNVPPRNALGTPRNDGFNVGDPGVSVWWNTRAHGQRVIACDRWATVRENVRACGLAVEALRAMERAGATQILERAFTAFGALPAAAAAAVVRPWWEVLGFPEALIGALTAPVIEARFRELAPKAHPDRGGTNEAMAELNNARDQALAHFRGSAQ